MNYLLDSNTISEVYAPSSPGHATISSHLGALTDQDQVFVSIVSLYELEYGWANAPDSKKKAIRRAIEDVQTDFGILMLSTESAKKFGELKKIIKDSRSPSKNNMKKFNVDLMLAATAITKRCIFVSADNLYEDLRRLHSTLLIQNWTM